MDLKEAREISNGGGEDYDTGHADGFLEGREKATKAAEPLLEVISEYSKALGAIASANPELPIEYQPKILQALVNIAREALASSAHVVAEYRKNTLGE